jgi:hypothetical protein
MPLIFEYTRRIRVEGNPAAVRKFRPDSWVNVTEPEYFSAVAAFAAVLSKRPDNTFSFVSSQ